MIKNEFAIIEIRTYNVFVLHILCHDVMYLITDRKEGIVYKKGGTEIGKNLAEKSKGLFSADDWQCKT